MKKWRNTVWIWGLMAVLAGCGGGTSPSGEPFAKTAGQVTAESPFVSDSPSTPVADSASGDRKSAVLGQAVYRFFSLGRGVHFYTMSVSERDSLLTRNDVFRYEGPAFYAVSGSNTAYIPVYRFQNLSTGTHFYTASETEKAAVQSQLAHLYQYEGIAWRARAQSAAGWVPMRRFFVASSGVHFYTANSTEYTTLLQTSGYQYEGVAYYVQPLGIEGSLDPSFGTDGKVVYALPTNDQTSAGTVRLNDGRLLMGGLCRAGDSYRFCVARYLANGSLDTSFGAGGWASLQVSTFRASADAFTALQDGRIVVGGSCADLFDLGNYFCLTRFTADGAIDTTFGTNGISRFHASALPYGGVVDGVKDMVASSDATLWVAGDCSARFCVAKVLENGSLDTTYGSQGVATVAATAVAEVAYAIQLDSQGRTVLAGTCRGAGSDAYKFCLMRLDDTGALDATFGTAGATRHHVGFSIESSVESLQHLAGGGWLAAGSCQMSGDTAMDFCATRYSEDGVLDTAYGTGGAAVQPVLAGLATDQARSATLDAQGRLVIVGQCSGGSVAGAFCGLRLNASGSLDTTFGSGGRLVIDMPGLSEVAQAVVLDPDGRLVFGGHCLRSVTNVSDHAFCMARYLPY